MYTTCTQVLPLDFLSSTYYKTRICWLRFQHKRVPRMGNLQLCKKKTDVVFLYFHYLDSIVLFLFLSCMALFSLFFNFVLVHFQWSWSVFIFFFFCKSCTNPQKQRKDLVYHCVIWIIMHVRKIIKNKFSVLIVPFTMHKGFSLRC